MRIALFLSGQLPQAGGGYTFEAQLLEAILNKIKESSHTLILYTFDQELPHFSVSRNLQVVSLYCPLKEKIKSKLLHTGKAILNKIRFPRSQFIVERWFDKYTLDALKSDQIDILLSLNPSSITTDVPFIIPVWDLQHRLQPYFPEVSIDNEWNRREKIFNKTLKRATFILAGTETGKAEIEKFYQIPSERIKVIPFFTPKLTVDEEIDQNILAKYNIPDQYLFYPAQFWPHKNHTGLLKAINLLKEKYLLNFPLVFVGSDKGNETHIKEVVEKLNLSTQVYFLGFVPQEDMASLYRHAFALSFVSYFGPDNLPPLEAMFLGCPVIAANVSGAKEQLGDNAILVDPRHPEAIAQAIKSLWDNPDLRNSLIQKGYQRASQWTPEDYVKELFAVINEFETIRICWKY